MIYSLFSLSSSYIFNYYRYNISYFATTTDKNRYRPGPHRRAMLSTDNSRYYLLFLAETFTMCVNVFYITRNKISVGSDKKLEISPWTPIIETAYFCNVMSIDITLQKWVIFIMGVYGEISQFLSDPTEILSLVI